jgi:probable F420-dependent oxidoreductase
MPVETARRARSHRANKKSPCSSIPREDLRVKLYVALPTDHVDLGPDFVSGAGVAAVARAAEEAGFDGVYSTEHPFPDDAWLASGGHQALDPFVGLSFAAAATTRLRVLTNLCVLPYRNPFLAARAAASLDVLSGGRLDLGVGAGYLEGEFRALGVDFDGRNDRFDEAIAAITAAWSGESVRFAGDGFEARGNTMRPAPVQRPRPPIWIGGNSARALRRAARLGDGWLPLPNPRALGNRRRSAHLEDLDDLRRLLARLDDERAAARRDGTEGTGRRSSFDVLVYPMVPFIPGTVGFAADALVEHAHELRALGVTGFIVGLPSPSRRAYADKLAEYGDAVVPRLRDV